jgi:hypothetical protein
VRRFRRIIAILALSLVLISALLAGVIAVFVYAIFGSDRALVASGPTIKSSELQSCSAVLIDVERINISDPNNLTLLPSIREEIKISLSPEVEFNAGLMPRESVDAAILGYDTCIATFESNSWSVMHSALGEPWLTLGEIEGFTASGTGTSISFDVAQSTESSLMIATSDPSLPFQQIQLSAEISHSQANVWAVGLLIVAAALVWLFIVLTVVFIVHTRKGARV